jgi:hypothetical protein
VLLFLKIYNLLRMNDKLAATTVVIAPFKYQFSEKYFRFSRRMIFKKYRKIYKRINLENSRGS